MVLVFNAGAVGIVVSDVVGSVTIPLRCLSRWWSGVLVVAGPSAVQVGAQ